MEEAFQDVVGDDLEDLIQLINIVEAEMMQLQPENRNIQFVLELTEKRYVMTVLLASFVLGEERATFIYQKVAESFRSDIYMNSEESIWEFLEKLTLKFKKQKLKGFDETDNQKHLEICNIYKRMGMVMTEQERIDMHINMQEED